MVVALIAYRIFLCITEIENCKWTRPCCQFRHFSFYSTWAWLRI